MKLYIKTDGRRFFIPAPTVLLTNRALIGWALRSHVSSTIPQETVDALCRELRRLKKQGPWELLEAETGDGKTKVRITL